MLILFSRRSRSLAPMFSSFSLPFSGRFFSSNSSSERTAMNIPSVKIYDVESATDKTTKRLQSLLKLNHTNHSLIYNGLRYHNHTPHILGSSYILGATPDLLNTIYDAESSSLEPWKDSPGEISKDDWRDYLGKRNYQRAYVDFFEDQLVSFGYDWKKLLEHYLFEGKEPLINGMTSGVGHPLIHLGYAYELNNRTVGIESLALGTCFYDDLHKYIDDPSYTRPGSYSKFSALEIFKRVASDARFANHTSHRAGDNIAPLFSTPDKEALILEHWNAWAVSEETIDSAVESACEAAVALFIGSHERGTSYDFFLVHVLTTAHAVRILLPFVPAQFRLPLIRSWFLFGITHYVGQKRPTIDEGRITGYKLGKGKDSWDYVKDAALQGRHNTDAHFVKAVRAILVSEETWGSRDGWWLKAACKFTDEFGGWGGFY